MNEQANDEVALSDRERAIIFGSLLGDGSLKLHKGYANARFSFRHSSVQSEYFHWKARELRAISADVSVFRQKPDGWSDQEKLRFQSRALPALTTLYSYTHDQHRFRVRRRWLNDLTPLALAVWWCDDGSLVGGGRKGVICTDGFDESSVRLIARYLKIVWKVECHVGAIQRRRGSTRDRYWRLWLGTEELKKFLRIILPHLPVSSMMYKFLLRYNDPQLQQRWISEMSALSGYAEQDIRRELQTIHGRKRTTENDIVHFKTHSPRTENEHTE